MQPFPHPSDATHNIYHDWPTGFSDIQVWKRGTEDDDGRRRTDDGRTTDHCYTIIHRVSLRLRWANKTSLWKLNERDTLYKSIFFFFEWGGGGWFFVLGEAFFHVIKMMLWCYACIKVTTLGLLLSDIPSKSCCKFQLFFFFFNAWVIQQCARVLLILCSALVYTDIH